MTDEFRSWLTKVWLLVALGALFLGGGPAPLAGRPGERADRTRGSPD